MRRRTLIERKQTEREGRAEVPVSFERIPRGDFGLKQEAAVVYAGRLAVPETRKPQRWIPIEAFFRGQLTNEFVVRLRTNQRLVWRRDGASFRRDARHEKQNSREADRSEGHSLHSHDMRATVYVKR